MRYKTRFTNNNSVIEPYARFLLSLLKHLTIDFPSHFILSIIDVHRDSASHDKLIFPSSITRILRHFSVPFLASNHFIVMCAIDATTIKHYEAQFRSRQSDSATPPSRSAPSRSTPSTSTPSFLRAMCHLKTSWRSFNAWMLALIHSLKSCVR